MTVYHSIRGSNIRTNALAGSIMIISRWMIIPILVLSSCKTPTSPLSGTPSDLSLATKVAAISGQNYTLSTTLWRDFQPISPPDGKPLIVVVNIIESNAEIFSTGVRADSLWIISGNQVWSGIFSTENRSGVPAHIREKIARDGPKWGPGIQVDVVVRLLDKEERFYLLKAENQLIQRTD